MRFLATFKLKGDETDLHTEIVEFGSKESLDAFLSSIDEDSVLKHVIVDEKNFDTSEYMTSAELINDKNVADDVIQTFDEYKKDNGIIEVYFPMFSHIDAIKFLDFMEAESFWEVDYISSL